MKGRTSSDYQRGLGETSPLVSPIFNIQPTGSSSARTNTGLEPFSGPWTESAAGHLLRRTMIGPTRFEILQASADTLDAVLSRLLAPQSLPPLPRDPNVPGRDWTTAPFSDLAQINYQYDRVLKEWWMDLMMLRQAVSVQERMVLFWHNHLASQAEVVRDARFMYRQNLLFRANALGNIRDLIRDVTLDAAMLRYLNGYLNRIPTPDENYARELLELFTIGKRPGAGPQYTEDDVRAAARVLTGWTVERYSNPSEPVFVERFHDAGDKQFSGYFGGTVIRPTQNPDGSLNGLGEINDLIDMIFRHPETPAAFCRKLYRWFVYHEIDDAAEANVIQPLAGIMKNAGFEMRPTLEALFRSSHFFDPRNVGCVIKNPLEYAAGTIRRLLVPFPGSSSQESDALVLWCVYASEGLGMDLLEPPNVAGWPAYHQAPGYYRHWINTTSLPARRNVTDSVVYGIRPHGTEAYFGMDVIAYAGSFSNPGDPFALVAGIAADLLPPIYGGTSLTAEQTEYLLYSVMQLVRNDEYEWTAQWNAATAGSEESESRKVVAVKLQALVRYIMQMPEYQLM